MEYIIRKMKKHEYSLLNDFLYEAIFVPEGMEAPSRDIINKPELQVYVSDFGSQKDDLCLVAEINGNIVGAVWVRDMKDYGNIGDGIPSFAISLYKEYRGNGIGTELMKAMIGELKSRGYSKASLSVQKMNYAARMYQKLGFEIIGENKDEYIMMYRLKTNILLTAFCGSSAELLIKDVKVLKEAKNFKNTNNYRTLFLPNDKIKDSEKLIDIISNERIDYIISFGQRPNIKNKVHIETTAKYGEFRINTNFDCDKLMGLFEQNSIISKISHNAGTPFCNELYLNGLKYIYQNKPDTKMVFIHIPFTKNIADFDSFRRQMFSVIKEI